MNTITYSRNRAAPTLRLAEYGRYAAADAGIEGNGRLATMGNPRRDNLTYHIESESPSQGIQTPLCNKSTNQFLGGSL